MSRIGDEHSLAQKSLVDPDPPSGSLPSHASEPFIPEKRTGGVFRQAHEFFVRHPYMSLMIAMVEIQIGFINAFDIFGQDDFIQNNRTQAWGLAAMAWLLTVYLLFCSVQGLRRK